MIRAPKKSKDPASARKPEATANHDETDEQAYNFRFVEVGEPSQGRDEGSRSTIRSHVMRDYYEKKDNRRRRPSILPGPSSTTSQKGGVVQQTHRFKVGPHGLQEVKAGRKKSKGKSRAAIKTTIVATILSEPKDIQAQSSSSPRALSFDQPESATFTLSDHPHRQADAGTSEDRQWPAAESDIVIGNALLPPQSGAGRRNIKVSDTISPTSGVIEPFSWLPAPCAPRTQLLLYHAFRQAWILLGQTGLSLSTHEPSSQAVLSSRVMGPLRTEWLLQATQDQAFFHAALSHYAGNYGLTRAEGDPIEAVRFRMEAVKIINERLEVVDTALIDGTLGTVASLASYEATNGNLTDIRTHMKGLERMVVLRGGLQDPSINPFTKRLVLWADLNCAIAMGTNPVFPGLELDHFGSLSTSHATDEEQAKTSNAHPSRSKTSKATSVESLNKELKQNFNNLKRLAEVDTNKKDTSGLSKEERCRDSDILYITERSLLTISNIWGPRKFVTSGCLAAIIFSDNQLRGINFRALVIDRVAGRLQLSLSTVLDEISQHDLQESSAKAILWALFVGAIAAAHRPSREWYIERLLDFCDVLDIQTWEDAGNILQGFLWPAPWQTQGRSLWNEVEENRLMKYTTFPDATPDNNMESERDAMEQS